HVVMVGEWLNKNTIMSAEIKCKECERKIVLFDGGLANGFYELTDWHGCGGIAVEPDTFVCGDCMTSCDKCGTRLPASELNEGCLCEYCKDEVK
ncbi:hypothetical protein LRR18_18665, partial [Mangrovimonas sp. AS39]|uniref:hypothetical protein n=1 Tax=Mangrovimonas futianensis TaxID=2895523 RepID=UPI001E323661